MKRYRIYEAMVRASRVSDKEKRGRIKHKDWKDWEPAEKAILMLAQSTTCAEWGKAWQAEEWEVEGES